jgi:murein DD-endopeptidase MepM/ murein hydrolase activator NlpD
MGSSLRPLPIVAMMLALTACIPHKAPDPATPSVGALPPAKRPTRADQVAVPPAAKVTPAWIARPVVPDAKEIPPSTYVVRPGDSLGRVAERTGAASEAIARENRIRPPYTIMTGQRLRIPGGRWHKVKPGETGIAIARAYGVDWSQVTTANHIEEPYVLRAGQRLLLPSRAQASAMSIEQRAQAFRVDIDDLITGGEPALAANATTVAPVARPTRKLPASAAVGEPARFAGRFAWPLTGRILTRFGPIASGRRSNGINIAAPLGTPVLAAADGVVAFVGELATYGGLILLRHGDGWITAYGHAEELLVTRGQAVKRGQIIARAGETGSANQPQLHFEIRNRREPVDPIPYLPARS